MSNLTKAKHLKIEDNLIIEYGLDQNYALKEIAARVGKDLTTISKEIKRNKFLKTIKRKEDDIKPCMHRRNCNKINLCNKKLNLIAKYYQVQFLMFSFIIYFSIHYISLADHHH